MGRKPSFKVGETINHFLILDLLPSEGAGHARKYLIKCPKCAIESVMVRSNIVKSNSCGCAKRDSSTWKRIGPKNKPWMLPFGEASFNALLNSYKQSAKRRAIEFCLTPFEFKDIVTSSCVYCGSHCQSIKHLRGANGGFNYTGIDRKDNTEGYTASNSVSCCKTCNFMKLDHTSDFFISHLQKILNHLNNENHVTLV
jgi:hypothetical protein